MADANPTKKKDLKDLQSWEDDLASLKPVAREPNQKGPKPVIKSSSQDAQRLTEQLESEWDSKIREAKKSDTVLVKASDKTGSRYGSIDEVFETLKKEEAERPTKIKVGEKISDTRIGKIGGRIIGEAPVIKERELTGQAVTGLYTLHPLGALPPFNILSKVLYNISGKFLARDLKAANISLYPDEYANFAVAMGAIFAIIITLFVVVLTGFSVSGLMMGLLVFILGAFLIAFFVINAPHLQLKSGSSDVDKQLPFALRHMSALLSAGISIFDSLVSVSKTDYGHLTKELDTVVWDVKSGENLSDALDEASRRIGSHSFTRVTVHIRRALQMGGDVASIISQIADDLSFEMRMKVSDFVEKLNAFAIVYIIGGIVGPVVISVFSIVGSAGSFQQQGLGGGGIDQVSLLFLMIGVFPLMMALIAYIVHVMEPKV